MTVGANRRGVRRAAVALYEILVRPSATLCSISERPATYLVPSVAVFAAAMALHILWPLDPLVYQTDDDTGVIAYRLFGEFMQGIVTILGIFWIGRRWGGTRSLRMVFSVLAYCFVPAMLGMVVSSAGWMIYDHAIPEFVLLDGMGMAFSYGDYVVQFVIGVFFIGWTFLLNVKAIRIVNGFGYARSVAVLALAILITYAAGLVEGIITVTIDEFVL